MMKMSRGKVIALHIIACALFLTQPIWLATNPPDTPLQIFARPTIRDFIANALLLTLFYLNFYLLIPQFYFRKKYLLYALAIIAGFLLVCFLPSLITGRNLFESSHSNFPLRRNDISQSLPPLPRGSTLYQEIKHHIFLFASVIFFSLLLRVRSRLLQSEAARHQAELSSLKSQINPHFLFNTLNSIYSLAVKKDDKTPDAIINLSELMRYIIKDATDDKIPLQTELNYLRNYVELQQTRLGYTVAIDLHIPDSNITGKQIAPLILISFIENAFKYGVNPDVESEIKINVEVNANKLRLMVRNNKVAEGRDIVSSGIGLKNTNDRLQLIYPGLHTLDIREDSTSYLVNLSIDLL